MCISCRPHVDVHKGGSGSWTHVERGGGVNKLIFCGRHKWMVPNSENGVEGPFVAYILSRQLLLLIGLCHHGPPIEDGAVLLYNSNHGQNAR